jgi:hypothetical protein
MRWRPLVAFFLLFGVADVAGQAQLSAAPPGTSSLTFVFDKTGSMYDDLVQVREGAKKIFATVLEQREKLIYNYVLVPFHDPGQPWRLHYRVPTTFHWRNCPHRCISFAVRFWRKCIDTIIEH